MPSTSSRSNSRQKNRGLLILATVFVFLSIAFITLRSSGAQALASNANDKTGESREQYLRAASAATFHADPVQKALGDYYLSISQPKLAGKSYEDGSSKLDSYALRAYYQAGEYAQASKFYKKDIPDLASIEVKVLFSQGKVEEGCKLAGQAGTDSKDLQKACDILKDSRVSRTEAYQLIALDISAPAIKVLMADVQKTPEDWLTLIAIAAKAGKADEAKKLSNDAAQQFPYDMRLAQIQRDFSR